MASLLAGLDLEILGKVEQNRFILGMSQFSIGILFNTITFCVVIATGLVKQSTGLYLLFLMVADTMSLITLALMEEFRNSLIDVDVFSDSDDPLKLCQAIFFMREMFYYWRWFLMAMLITDRCLLVSGVAGGRLRLLSLILSPVLLVVSGGLAGYWIHWVEDTRFAQTGGLYVPGLCLFAPAPAGDTSSTWYYMETIGNHFRNAISSDINKPFTDFSNVFV